MKKKQLSALKVAAVYIGTVVGAGFATGQEVLQFFVNFGIYGFIGIAITTIGFMYFGYLIMDLGSELYAKSHLEVIKYAGGKIIGSLIDVIITFFLFGAFTAMIAGTGALFTQQFNLPAFIGNILMALLTAVTVLTGFRGVIESISFVVPFLLVSVIGISVYAIINTPPNFLEITPVGSQGGLITNWLLAAILYISYNTILSVAVLGPLGAATPNRQVIKEGAILGGLGLGIGTFMIYLALNGNIADITNLEVPMLFIAGNISHIIQMTYAAVLIAEIYTTAVGSLYGFVSRLTISSNLYRGKNTLTIIITLAALIGSQLGFTNLVKFLYPIVGYGGIVLLIFLIIAGQRNKIF